MADDILPGAGDVVITLPAVEAGKEPRKITLRCNAEAAFALSQLPGGIFPPLRVGGEFDCVAQRVRASDLPTMLEVLRIAVGAAPSADKRLPEKVFAFGLWAMRDELTTYLYNLGNGGKPLQTEGGAPGDGDPPKPPAEDEERP